MDSILLQKQVRDNSEELRSYLKDLTLWEDEMKRKEGDLKDSSENPEGPVKKKVKNKNKKNSIKSKDRIKGSDYKAWDKFDADAECEKVDEKTETEEESSEEDDTSEEYLKRLRDEAVYEKERGNQFVRHGKWDEAITCYSHAITCYAEDPIFFANRALCYLKKSDFRSAEADCTSALKFDPNYVKALQRRAAARSGFKQYNEAVSDLKRVLELEPHNVESKKELMRIEKLTGVDIKNNVTTEDTIKYVPPGGVKKIEKPSPTSSEPSPGPSRSTTPSTPTATPQKPIGIKEDIKIQWPNRPNAKPVKTTQKLPHQQSKVPLKRIPIEEKTEGTEIKTAPVEKLVKKPESITKRTDDESIIEDDLVVPKSSVQFISKWKQMRQNNDLKYSYLKRINPADIPVIFCESMESDIFGDIIVVLSEKVAGGDADVFSYLKYLSTVKRFSTLVMFMALREKNELIKLFDYCTEGSLASEEEIMQLKRKYEI